MYCQHILYRNVCIYFFFSHATFGTACDAGESIVRGTNDNFPYIYLYTGTHRKASRLKRQVSASYTTQREASRFKRHFSASCHTHRNIQQRKASPFKRQFPAQHRNTQRKASPLKRQSPAQHRNTQRKASPLKRHSPALHRNTQRRAFPWTQTTLSRTAPRKTQRKAFPLTATTIKIIAKIFSLKMKCYTHILKSMFADI